MLNIKKLFILTLFVGACTSKSNRFNPLPSAALVNHSGLRSSRVLLQILTDCRKGNETIVVIDDSGKLDSMWLQQLHQQFYAVLLLRGYLLDKISHFDYKKIDAILITVSDFKKFGQIFNQVHAISWWSSMIPVYMLHLPKNSCDSSREILQRAWKPNILTSYYFCGLNRVFTSNPLTNQAPKVWKEVPFKTNWTLYRRDLDPANNCEGFHFDRTQHLKDYLLNATSQTFEDGYTSNYFAYRSLLLLELLSISLRMKYQFRVKKKVYVLADSSNYKSRSQERMEVYKTNINNQIRSDLIIDNFYLKPEVKATEPMYVLTYPLAWYESGIAVKHRGYQKIGEKLWGFYGIWTILFTVFILITTFIVIWFTHNRNTAFATFEVIRLLISHSLYTPMNSLFLRIFFFSVLIYFLIIQATFNGHLAKFLTKLERRTLPETGEDLRDLGYTSIQDGNTSFHLLNPEQPIVKQRSRECTENILHEDLTACIYEQTLLFRHQIDLKAHTKIHISKNPIETQYVGFQIIKNHPLADRVNRALMALEDFGFRQWLSKSKRKWTLAGNTPIVMKTKSNNYFRPISLEHLMFSFWILAIGLGSATCSFCVELLISHKEIVLNLMEDIKTRCLRKLRRMNINSRHGLSRRASGWSLNDTQ